MQIPETLLKKAKRDSLRTKTSIILEKGWAYLQTHFTNENDYMDFLKNISQENYEKFLYTIFFYWTHDLYLLVPRKKSSNIDGFMYQITLSISEYLNEGKTPKEKVRKFSKNFTPEACKKLNEKITASSLKGNPKPDIDFWEILYDMRNEFIHEAKWFNIIDRNSSSTMFLSSSKHDRVEYLVKVEIKFATYLDFFWEAYLNFLGYKKPTLTRMPITEL